MCAEPLEHEDIVPNYIARLTQAPLLAPDEEQKLTKAAKSGDTRARQRLVEANMRLVINIAKSYRSRSVPLEDLVQEGAIGLMYAVERFDPSKGFRFSTYATHWVRQAIGRAIDNKSKAIRLPAHISQCIRRIEREKTRLTRELGSEPSLEQLSERIGLSTAKLLSLMQFSHELVSLDMKVGESEGSTLGSLLKCPKGNDPESELISGEMIDELQEIMRELTEREQRVVKHRLRVDAADRETMRENLARELQLSRERVRQIEIQAIKKLRAVATRRRLRELLN